MYGTSEAYTRDDGFTYDEAIDVLNRVDNVTIRDACRMLEWLGFADIFYLADNSYPISYLGGAGSGGYTLDKFRRDHKDLMDYDASDLTSITFQGGPDRDNWLCLDFNCLLIDFTAACIIDYGAAIVKRSIEGK